MQIESNLDFGAEIVTRAYEEIKARGFDSIHCSLTGAVFGQVNADEIKAALRIALDENPLASWKWLVEGVERKQFLWSQKPAPTLQFHKDHNTLVRVLRSDPSGPAKLFSYLAGRFFFESLVSERYIHSSMVREARFYFLGEFYQRVAKLPPNWHQSLTENDEVEGSESTIQMLNRMVNMEPTPLDEAKAAQRCLESLLRLDAIYNLRSRFYDVELKEKLILFRESHEWTFTLLHTLLNEFEENAIIRLAKQKVKPQGNPMVLTAALESISWNQRRIERLREKLELAEQSRRIGPNSRAGDILQSIRETLNDVEVKGKLSKKDKQNLESAAKALEQDLSRVSWSDKRLDVLQRLYGRQADSKETVRTIKGAKTLKHLAEALIDSGKPVPQELKKKIEKAIDSGKIKSKPKKKSAGKAVRFDTNRFNLGSVPDLSDLSKKD